jgi:hypothetical protein
MEGSKTRYVDNTSPLFSAGLTIRQKEPKNLESPFDRIDSYLTPMELFYIRSHFPIPVLDRASYKLRIDGAVRSPFALSYDELRNMPSETRVATLECAGIVGSFSSPRCKGHSGNSERSAMRNGPACPCEPCWSVPAWLKMLARSCSKERIAG